jgi:hypothetical protein
MRSWFRWNLPLFVFLAAIGQPAFACQCGASSHGLTLWDRAKDESDRASVIFEGVPERFDFAWDLISAKEGTMVSCDGPGRTWHSVDPHMLITFRVTRPYKGSLGTEVKLNTLLGGGDCGARFSPGLTYLVYASAIDADHLWVSMCSPGGWIEEATIATNLRYLRKEHPLAADLSRPKPVTPEIFAAGEKQRHQHFQERQKRLAAATGRICGTVIQESIKGTPSGSISFLSTQGYSPVEHPTAQVSEDGSFCSDRLGSSSYYLFFAKTADNRSISSAYYPGVTSRARATPVTVAANSDQSNIVFKVPTQKAYAVRGFISTNDKTGIGPQDVVISLVNPRMESLWGYAQAIDFTGTFPLPRTRYFSFDHIAPGRYIVWVSVRGQGWTMKKVELEVRNHDRFTFVEITHKKLSTN